MKLKSIALAALGMATLAPAVQTAKAETSVSIPAKQKEGVVKPVRSARQIVREDAGGLQVISRGGSGTPPHIYGEYHVRRGTHNRTNR